MAHERNSSKNFSANGSTRESVRARETLAQEIMQATEAERLREVRTPFILGSLWYCPVLGIVWQVVRIYGHGCRADLAIIELGAFVWTEKGQYWCRRRLTAEELTFKYIFYNSVHNTAWGIQ